MNDIEMVDDNEMKVFGFLLPREVTIPPLVQPNVDLRVTLTTSGAEVTVNYLLRQ
jgi:hypothetical protein